MLPWFFLLLFPVCLIIGWILFTKVNVRFWVVATVVIFGFLLALSQGFGYKTALNSSKETRQFHVKHKERVGGDDGKYLVFTTDGVFSVEDSWWLWKFDASDRYNEIEEEHDYTCTVAGWRIHFTSDYENLISCTET